MNTPIFLHTLCLTYCTRGFQTGLVRAGRGRDIGRVEFR